LILDRVLAGHQTRYANIPLLLLEARVNADAREIARDEEFVELDCTSD
jgi:hypothetical protein